MSAPDPAEELARLRAEIELVDREILHLAARRARLGMEAGVLKESLGLALLVPEQEAEVRRRALEVGVALGLSREDVEALFDRLIAIARRAQGIGRAG